MKLATGEDARSRRIRQLDARVEAGDFEGARGLAREIIESSPGSDEAAKAARVLRKLNMRDAGLYVAVIVTIAVSLFVLGLLSQ